MLCRKLKKNDPLIPSEMSEKVGHFLLPFWLTTQEEKRHEGTE